MSKFAIMLGGEDVWFTDGVPDRFDTEEDAIKAIAEEIAEQEEDVRLGYLDDCSYEEYRIVEVAA